MLQERSHKLKQITMKPLWFLPLLLLLLSSCKNEREEQLKRDIVGEWKFVSEEQVPGCSDSELLPPPPPGQNITGYGFYADGLCEYKPGFHTIQTLNDAPVIGYEGKKCSYVISEDSLKIIRESGQVWYSYKVEHYNKDTLYLKKDNSIVIKMARLHYVVQPSGHYDAIEVVSPFGNVKINNNGNVLYEANAITGREGYLTGNITKQKYSELERDFLKINVKALNTSYSSMASEGDVTKVKLIRNGKIVTQIRDFGQSSPAELQWAYRNLIYLFVDKSLTPYATNFPKMLGYDAYYYAGKRRCQLYWDEKFRLVQALNKAKEVRVSFVPKYRLTYGFSMLDTYMNTDGRYYELPPEEGGKTLDLGYDFIERNGLKLSAFSD